MSDKIYLSFEDVKDMVIKVCKSVEESDFTPDIIVPIVRGGAVPGAMISHHFNLPMVCVHWSTRTDFVDDFGGNESNCWLPELALEGKKILIVDDILDSGVTINELKADWQASVFDELPWGTNIQVAALQQRTVSDVNADFVAEIVSSDEWVVYPWEEI